MLRVSFRQCLIFLSALVAFNAHALDLSGVTQKEAGSGLKETLTHASEAAVSQLGAADGFLNNPKVKIPLPDGLKQAEKAMKLLGKGDQFQALEVSINRAAEAAMPEAKALLINAVKSMSVQDAKSILSGGDDAVTQFFRSKTETQLGQKFLPIVKGATDRVGLAKQYNKVADQAASFGAIKKEDSKIESYVTRKALDGLFLTLAEEERAIRNDPVGTGSALLKKIFAN
ncbi:MAG: DUF4197 domain-containing protein [Rhodocyclaceae bacterium]|nr:DUF4197 domain-containing protein [Rhodocyclaceae bacterium]